MGLAHQSCNAARAYWSDCSWMQTNRRAMFYLLALLEKNLCTAQSAADRIYLLQGIYIELFWESAGSGEESSGIFLRWRELRGRRILSKNPPLHVCSANMAHLYRSLPALQYHMTSFNLKLCDTTQLFEENQWNDSLEIKFWLYLIKLIGFLSWFAETKTKKKKEKDGDHLLR